MIPNVSLFISFLVSKAYLSLKRMGKSFDISIFFLLCSAISVNCFVGDPTCFQTSTSKRADDCCYIPKLYDSQLVSDCLMSMGNSTDQGEKYKCLVACIAKKLNVFKDNNLDKAAAQRLFNTKVGSNPNFGPLIGESFEECYGKLSVNMAYEQTNPPKCSALPMILMDCLQTKLFLNCPTEVWQGGSECDELKEKLNKGCPFVAIASL